MQTKRNPRETGNVLICVLGSILILSLIGATVLQSSATRLNASTNQVRAWKESLSAAESGGDVAFAEIRKHLPGSNPATWWSGWTAGTNSSGTPMYTKLVTGLGASNLGAQAVVEPCYFGPSSTL